jgi:toxin ParE1/3/4
VAQRQARLRASAAVDVDAAIAHLRNVAGDAAALSFIDALEHGINLVRRSPHAGSSRFAHELAIPELRAWAVKRFPYVIFYVPYDDHIDVWRVLHTRQDIPTRVPGDG